AHLALFSSRATVFLTVMLAGVSFVSHAQVAPSSRNIAPISGNGIRITINDASNHLWVLQSSTNLTTWTDAAVWKVFNGSFHSSFAPDPGRPTAFFRAVYDSTRTDLPNTTIFALLLPQFTYNYATP